MFYVFHPGEVIRQGMVYPFLTRQLLMSGYLLNCWRLIIQFVMQFLVQEYNVNLW
ncbi:hypothetical protein SP19_162 [Salmonella phage 19]|nr:hypothetical protein SP19_162 [Salmonella phage 19]